MKILLAIPSARYIETECFVSLFEMEKTGNIELFIPNSYSVDVARNVIAKYAQDNKFDYILWVDSDMLLPKDTLTRLLSHDTDIVSGVYRYKLLNDKRIVAKRLTGDDYIDVLAEELYTDGEITEVDAFGFGCVLMKVSVLEKIPYPWFVYTLEMGEDVYFCRKAQNAGFTLYLDKKIICGHKGQVNYDIKEKANDMG